MYQLIFLRIIRVFQEQRPILKPCIRNSLGLDNRFPGNDDHCFHSDAGNSRFPYQPGSGIQEEDEKEE